MVMAKKIFLSPSNQTKNTYAAGGTNEAVQCGRIGKACKAALERCGFSVKMIQYDTMANRVAAANNWGADLYVPIHTNAHGASGGSNGGTCMFYYSTSSKGYKAAMSIYKTLAPVSPGTADNYWAYPGLYEVKKPKAPVAYVEAEFHDVAKYAKWIINNTTTIGEAICKGICNYFGVKYVAPVTVKWEKKDGIWYAYKDGKMLTSEWVQHTDGFWYWLKADGKMAVSEFIEDGGSKYYLDAEGKMLTGWQQIGGTWYLFADSGAMSTNSWKKTSGKWYWLKDDGRMAVSETLEINGAWHKFDAEGVWLGETETPVPEPENGAKLYRVIAGSFAVRENAENVVEKLKAAGFEDVYIKED